MADQKRTCTYDPLTELMAYYAGEKPAEDASVEREELSLEERLMRRIIDGDRSGIEDDLKHAMEKYAPLEIINTILLEGMKIVGELFGSGEMQLPFVLQSAETMKTAVQFLEPHMDRVGAANKGVIVLATVKGDVHDIGKNLVDIILTNNGYRVINLGIKVSVEQMMKEAREHGATAIGMSGLLVKSTVIMKQNVEVMKERGIAVPVVLGGAALNRRFVSEEIAPVYNGPVRYARDAFDGLRFMEELAAGKLKRDPETTPPRKKRKTSSSAAVSKPRESIPSSARSAVSSNVPIPSPPFFGSKVVEGIPLDTVFEYLNETALVRGQWQIRRGKRSDDEYREFVEREIRPRLRELQEQCKRENLLQPAVVYGYFPVMSSGDELIVYRPSLLTEENVMNVWPDFDKGSLMEWFRFRFPRQPDGRRLCIADFFRPVESGDFDVLGAFTVTMGPVASKHARELFADDRYQDYLFYHGLSVESAEALAERQHAVMRKELGIAGEDASDMRKLFSQGYRGSRYSFGYPACPNLEDQRKLFALLRPERIGVSLTDELQLVPEQSVTALVVHHPEAKYFMIR